MNVLRIGVNGIKLTARVVDDASDIFLYSVSALFLDKRITVFCYQDEMDVDVMVIYSHGE